MEERGRAFVKRIGIRKCQLNRYRLSALAVLQFDDDINIMIILER